MKAHFLDAGAFRVWSVCKGYQQTSFAPCTKRVRDLHSTPLKWNHSLVCLWLCLGVTPGRSNAYYNVVIMNLLYGVIKRSLEGFSYFLKKILILSRGKKFCCIQVSLPFSPVRYWTWHLNCPLSINLRMDLINKEYYVSVFWYQVYQAMLWERLLTSRGLPSDSTWVLKAKPSKLDIRKRQFGILFISLPIVCLRWRSNFRYLCSFSVIRDIIQKVQRHHDLIKAHAVR